MLLQELDKNVYENQYKSVFKHFGYNCHYKKRVSNKPDGVCICFKSDKFKLIEERSVEFHRPDIVEVSIDKIAPASKSVSLEPNRYHKGALQCVTHS
jgi:mRNA deadenylase 3'-5' endonuclease subunit Ccr4